MTTLLTCAATSAKNTNMMAQTATASARNTSSFLKWSVFNYIIATSAFSFTQHIQVPDLLVQI